MITSMSLCKCIVILFSAGVGLIPDGVTPDDAQAFYRLLQEASARHAAGQPQKAHEMIRAAEMIAGYAYNKTERAVWQLEIMETQIKVGDIQAAKKTLGYMDSRPEEYKGWCLLASAYYAVKEREAGDEAAKKATEFLSSIGVKGVSELTAVARKAQAAGQIDSARTVADFLQEFAVKARHSEATPKAFGEICILLVDLGEDERAMQLVKEYPATGSDIERLQVMTRIYAEMARRQNRSGKAKKAAKSFQAMGELLERVEGSVGDEAAKIIIDAYLAGGKVEQARAVIRRLDDPAAETRAWLQMATYFRQKAKDAPAALGALQNAAKAGAGLADDTEQQKALLRVVLAMNQAKEFDSALVVAGSIRLPQHKAMAYRQVAEAQHKAGDDKAALASYQEARDVIRADNVKWRRELAWKHLILSMKRSGLPQAETWALDK